jgi:hypothetical protein
MNARVQLGMVDVNDLPPADAAGADADAVEED